MSFVESLQFSGQVISNEDGGLVVDIQSSNGNEFSIEYSGHPLDCPLPPGENVTMNYKPVEVTRRTVALSIAAGMLIDPTAVVPVLGSDHCITCALNKSADPNITPLCTAASAQRGTSRNSK